MDLTIYFEVFIDVCILFGDVLRNDVVGHVAGTTAKYPRAHRCRPQNCFFRCGNSASTYLHK